MLLSTPSICRNSFSNSSLTFGMLRSNASYTSLNNPNLLLKKLLVAEGFDGDIDVDTPPVVSALPHTPRRKRIVAHTALRPPFGRRSPQSLPHALHGDSRIGPEVQQKTTQESVSGARSRRLPRLFSCVSKTLASRANLSLSTVRISQAAANRIPLPPTVVSKVLPVDTHVPQGIIVERVSMLTRVCTLNRHEH